jgi:hypothetical protein
VQGVEISLWLIVFLSGVETEDAVTESFDDEASKASCSLFNDASERQSSFWLAVDDTSHLLDFLLELRFCMFDACWFKM